MSWDSPENSLRKIYQEYHIGSLHDYESEYLKKAFLFTEELWYQQYKSFSSICFVMLGEAPLFGVDQNYFYNSRTNFSSFFRYSDIKPGADNSPMEANKKCMYKDLRDLRFIILDVFPYAFNENDTKIFYGRNRDGRNGMSTSTYKNLLSASCHEYLFPKLLKIKDKAEGNIRFVARYSRMNVLEGIIKPKLIDLKLLNPSDPILSIHGRAQNMDSERLRRLYKEKCGSLDL